MRERILKLRSEGNSYRKIAAILGIGKTTADYYCNTSKKLHNQKIWRKNLKQKLVDMVGGKCSICGYNKCLAALVFHHTSSTKKEFHISRNKSLEVTMEEMKKCILVCSNCHNEIHDELTII